jgi:TRAP-type C4-dicarboxylate transport system substrate-binding protein
MTPTTTRRALLAGGTMLLAGRAPAQQQATTLRLYSANFETDAAMLASEVPTRTEGRYQIEAIIGFDMLEAALGKERADGGEVALLKGAQSGELDLVVVSYAIGDYVREVNVFLLPFLFGGYADARATLDGPIGQEILGRLPPHGLVGLAWSEGGFHYIANSKRPIRSPDDLIGVRLRTGKNPVLIEAFRTLGAEVVPMPMARPVIDALAQGDLDGVATDIDAMMNWEMFRWAKYLSLTHHAYVPAVIIMSKAGYDKLSDADKPAFTAAARLAGQAARKFDDDVEAQGLARLLDVGMEINADVDEVAFRAALAPAYAEWRQQFGELIERIEAHK